MANSLRASALFYWDANHADICLHPEKRQMTITTMLDVQQELDFSVQNLIKSPSSLSKLQAMVLMIISAILFKNGANAH